MKLNLGIALIILSTLAAVAKEPKIHERRLGLDLTPTSATVAIVTERRIDGHPTEQKPLVLFIDSEALTATAATRPENGVITYTITRGSLGTTPAAHPSGAHVWIGESSEFGTTDKSGACPPESPDWINVTDHLLWTCRSAAWVSRHIGDERLGSTNVTTNGTLTANDIVTGAGGTTVQDSNIPLNVSSTNTSIGIGVGALGGNTGANNSAFGYQALKANNTGQSNTATGSQALNSNTGGSNNDAFGYLALQQLTTGVGNDAFGEGALGALTILSGNSAFGFQALQQDSGANNDAFGYDTLQGNTSGSANSAFGFHALSSNTTGTDNVAVGSNAGNGTNPNISGSHDTFLGDSAGPASSTQQSYMTAIGAGSTCGASNTVCLGRVNTDAVVANGPSIQINQTLTVGTLPTCNSSAQGTIARVSDAAGSSGRLTSSSITNPISTPVYCDGTSWFATKGPLPANVLYASDYGSPSTFPATGITKAILNCTASSYPCTVFVNPTYGVEPVLGSQPDNGSSAGNNNASNITIVDQRTPGAITVNNAENNVFSNAAAALLVNCSHSKPAGSGNLFCEDFFYNFNDGGTNYNAPNGFSKSNLVTLNTSLRSVTAGQAIANQVSSEHYGVGDTLALSIGSFQQGGFVTGGDEGTEGMDVHVIQGGLYGFVGEATGLVATGGGGLNVTTLTITNLGGEPGANRYVLDTQSVSTSPYAITAITSSETYGPATYTITGSSEGQRTASSAIGTIGVNVSPCGSPCVPTPISPAYTYPVMGGSIANGALMCILDPSNPMEFVTAQVSGGVVSIATVRPHPSTSLFSVGGDCGNFILAQCRRRHLGHICHHPELYCSGHNAPGVAYLLNCSAFRQHTGPVSGCTGRRLVASGNFTVAADGRKKPVQDCPWRRGLLGVNRRSTGPHVDALAQSDKLERRRLHRNASPSGRSG